MDPLRAFRHEQPLNLVHLPQQLHHKNENADDEDEDEVEDEVEFVEEDRQCNLCKEQIWSFHLCYYSCKTCNYSLHKFCAELPEILQNHPLHPGHDLSFYSSDDDEFKCHVCNLMHKNIPQYYCLHCYFDMDIICATFIYGFTNAINVCIMCTLIVQLQKESRLCLGKTNKNFKEAEHPNLLHCPFQDEGDNLLKRYMSNQHELIGDSKQHEGEMLTHASHQHPLVLFDKQTPSSVSLHDPMKRIQLLCDGCVKPIMRVPFYVCCQYDDEQYCFVLHEWCAKLPLEVQEYVGHPEHTLFLLQKIPSKFFGVFECAVCELPSNGFAYGCIMCDFYVDINCAFIPKEITHDAHPNHLLSIVKLLKRCKACRYRTDRWGFYCPTCDFYIHVECALLLPRVIKHKCDKHPLNLRYEPAENHISKYFCEICEDEFTPWDW
ncbi:putative chromatin regulator PHD family [Helianthus annuus]|nr:putative chromatin regulator PHD family [Helianthus annuus]